jgi:hypothetical protein
MCVRFFCVCVQIEALRRADHPSKESYRLSLIKKLRKLRPTLQKREQAPKCGSNEEEKNLPNTNQMRHRLNEVVRFRTTWTLRVITTQIDVFQIVRKARENDQHIKQIITGQVRGEYVNPTYMSRTVPNDNDDVLRHRK